MKIIKIKAIGFDWDGTLVDSMRTKAKAFTEAVIRFYPQHNSLNHARHAIEMLYLFTGGTLRTEQLKLVQEINNLPSLSEKEIVQWSKLFTSLYSDKTHPLFDDTIRTLEELQKRGYKLFLCSSVPHDDLIRTLKKYPSLNSHFNLILGSRIAEGFRKGIPHFTYVSEQINVHLKEMAFVGDGSEDIKRANEAGCFSIGKIDSKIPNSMEKIKENNPKLVIEHLEELLIYFK